MYSFSFLSPVPTCLFPASVTPAFRCPLLLHPGYSTYFDQIVIRQVIVQPFLMAVGYRSAVYDIVIELQSFNTQHDSQSFYFGGIMFLYQASWRSILSELMVVHVHRATCPRLFGQPLELFQGL